MFWCSLLAIAPDFDLLGGPLGVPYESIYAHRGAAHSLLVAAGLGVTTGLVARRYGLPALRTGLLASLLVATHGLLDILNVRTKVAILWPFSNRFYSVPWQPLPAVSQLSDFLTPVGLRVVSWEVLIFSPFFLVALWPWRGGIRGTATKPQNDSSGL